MGLFHRVRWARALEGLLDDELDARRVDRLLAHLEACPECLAELQALARLQWAVGRLADAR